MKINAAIIGLGNIGLKYDLGHSKSNIFTHARAPRCTRVSNLSLLQIPHLEQERTSRKITLAEF